ncbi:MAG: PIN domain-containing protein [Candidatus Aminicenantes bacterium]|nr:PIN domain-containing protein [Candidatus Aminicenantes bacterium]
MSLEAGPLKVLVDTSAWLAFFRHEDRKTALAVRQAVADGSAIVPKIVLAELVQAAKSDRELAVIADLARSIPIADEGETTWSEAAALAHRLKRRGKTIPLADCYIAALVRRHDCRLLTLDPRFKDIAAD